MAGIRHGHAARAALLARVSADHGTEIKDPATGEVIGRVAPEA
jgi:hypothetical protein